MYNLLATSDELIQLKQVLIQKLLDEDTIVREHNDTLVRQLKNIDNLIKLAIDSEQKIN